MGNACGKTNEPKKDEKKTDSLKIQDEEKQDNIQDEVLQNVDNLTEN